VGSKSDAQTQAQSTSQQTLDPQIESALLGNYGNAQSLVANTPSQYTGQLVAPLNTTQQTAQSGLLGIANSGVGNAALSTAVGTVGNVAGYTPSTITPQTLSTANLSAYMNPYTSAVTSTTLAQLAQENQIADAANDASATSAGAFGGDRSAVQDALTNGQYALAGASTLAGLNQSNYSNAQTAAQSDIANNLSAQEANQNAGLQAANLNLSAGNSLGALSGQQLSQATALQNLIAQVGAQNQTQAQNVDTAAQQQFQTNLGNTVTMQQLIDQALGLAGDPTLGTSQSTSSGNSSTTTLSNPFSPISIPGS
jgi:hypothetical protein